MSDIITTLHPENDNDTNLYPNIKKENIPNGSVDQTKLSGDVNNILNGIDTRLANAIASIEQPKYYSTLPTSDVGLIVYSDGYIYSWNGTQYVTTGIVYQATLNDNKKIDYEHINYLDLNNITEGIYIDEDGNTITAPTFYETDYIHCEEGDFFTYNPIYNIQVAFYDKDKNFISGGTFSTTIGRFYIPKNVYYFRCFGLIAYKLTDMIIKNQAYPNTYISFDIITPFYNEYNQNALNHNIILKNNRINVLNLSEIIRGGYFDETNTWVSNGSFYSSGYIACDYGDNININATYTQKILCYDSNKAFLGATDVSINRNNKTGYSAYINVKNTKYIRLYGVTSNLYADMVVINKEYPSSYLPYNSFENYTFKDNLKYNLIHNWIGKKIVQLGDSITWYDNKMYLTSGYTNIRCKGLATYLKQYGFEEVENAGVSGACITQNVNEFEAISTTVDNIDFSNYDIVTIFGGTNDKGWQAPLGSLVSMSTALADFNKETFVGAYQYIIQKILNDNPTITILLVTPFRFNGWQNGTNNLTAYVDKIKELADFYALPILDYYGNSGVNQKNQTALTTDGTHPNNILYEKLARMMISKIDEL